MEWVCSVHPYREDALEALRSAASQGARAVKWLPPAMGMDPSSPRCDPFYQEMQRLDLPLLTHGGDELAARGGLLRTPRVPGQTRRQVQGPGAQEGGAKGDPGGGGQGRLVSPRHSFHG